MQSKTWARMGGAFQWKIGRTCRSTVLRERNARSTRGQVLVGGDHGVIAERGGRHRGAHDIDAVERCFGGDGVGLARERQTGRGDGDVEVLGHLVSIEHGADLQADPGPAS